MTAHAGDDALVVLRTAAGDRATLSLHGAQLLSWVPTGEREQLYASPSSHPGTGKAVRGGVPVCFPQFAGRGPLPKHGFARNSRWELLLAPSMQGELAELRCRLAAANASSSWEHAFGLVLCVRLGPRFVELELQVANTGTSAFGFTGALHTYLRVDSMVDAALHGLQGVLYEDTANDGVFARDADPELRVTGELDRVYRDAPAHLELRERGLPARRIAQQGFRDTVVWNPGPQKAATLGDMPAADWQRMLCVEAAAVHELVQLAPGATWRGTQRITLA
ncbi:MAG TPA: D-hexose-6-phosphate mutarotase [Ramlibacter sp.]|nr:D-hexose-6-phosphate mutarotase [Ramlibacter sp.]